MKTIQLKSKRIEAEIALPGEAYTGSRYDWSGIVTQVTLDGVHTFLSYDDPDENAVSTRGQGLIGIIDAKGDLGYDETPLIGWFPRLGVGLLQRGDLGPYIYYAPHTVKPFNREWKKEENSVEFKTYPTLCNGYAVEQVKTISLEEDTIKITNSFMNVGHREITFTEVNHNFFRFDEAPIDSSYVLTLPYNVSPQVRRGQAITGFNTVSPGEPDGASKAISLELRGFEGLASHFMKLENTVTGTGVSAHDGFSPSRGYVFCNPYTFAVEVFNTCTIKPGELYSFDRKYRFYSI